ARWSKHGCAVIDGSATGLGRAAFRSWLILGSARSSWLESCCFSGGATMCADRSYEPVSRTGRVCHAHCGMVGAAFAGAIACVPEATIVASAGDSSEDTMAWCTPPAAAVDILFVIDDSPSMAVRQDWLAASLQGSWLGLEEPARVRIAFTTTDTGNPL